MDLFNKTTSWLKSLFSKQPVKIAAVKLVEPPCIVELHDQPDVMSEDAFKAKYGVK